MTLRLLYLVLCQVLGWLALLATTGATVRDRQVDGMPRFVY